MLRETLIDGACPSPYQVAVADLNQDRKPDILVTCPGKGLIQWYEAPDWKKRVIQSHLHPGALDLAAYDLDGDGDLELAVLDEFHLTPSTDGGRILWLDRGASLDEEWTLYPIDAIPTAHRLRWAQLDLGRRKQLVVAPILGAGADQKKPRSVPATLNYYRIPDRPREGKWERHVIDTGLPVQHGVQVRDVDGDGLEEVLTASAAGTIIFHSLPENGGLTFRKQYIHPSESSEVFWSPRGPRDGPMIATIEPWHGHQVCVYLPPSEGMGLWYRVLLDDTLDNGHALWCADVDGDGQDEIIAGYRGKGTSIHVYHREDADGKRWKKTVLDSAIACEGLYGARVTTRGTDLVACGGSTHNVKLYENL